MAVKIERSWFKRRPVGLEGFNDREMLWLWCWLGQRDYELDENMVTDPESRAGFLIESIADRETVGSLTDYRDICFSMRLKDSEFSWIKYSDNRLVFFVLGCIEQRSFGIGPALTKFNQAVLSTKERIQLAFDLAIGNISYKKDVMENIRQAWSLAIEIDPSLDWLNKNDDDQCRWAVDEIWKSDIAQWISPSMQFPVSNEDRFLLIANTLDRSGLPLKLKTLFLGELKTKWNRKKKKQNAEKVQCNLNVCTATKINIEKLAKSKQLKMGELIDELVAKEMERLG